MKEHTSHMQERALLAPSQRKREAIIRVQEECLSKTQKLAVIKCFQGDVDIADSYLVLDDDEIRKMFLLDYSK